MELRDIEIFLTLAEELHFGRTAARLHLSQARVSQAIAQQERRIGGPLFDRSNRRRVRLTPLGVALENDLMPVYATLRDTLERARRSARGIAARLTVGMMPFNGPGLNPLWEAFRTRHPQYELLLRHTSFADPFGALRSGAIDILITWLPVEEPDLTVGPTLFTDPRVLAVSATHDLAGLTSAPVEALADYAHIRVPAGKPEAWEDGYLPFRTPRGHTLDRVQPVTHTDEILHLIGTGEIIHPFPAHVTHYWSMRHIRFLPLPDMAPLTYALVWRTETENDLIRALARTVTGLTPAGHL
ncbi:LysR family transcriptional regulator [Actinocorallia longicatena]|uniref:LysR family transcriptional regulator n=1 Tax=Actinocorallia longicatena TaxID=111803 RepID=A0ABP6QAG3_9ACTN